MGQLTERINARMKKLISAADGKDREKIINTIFEDTGIKLLPERQRDKIRADIEQMILSESQKGRAPRLLRESSYNVATANESGSTYIVGVFASANTVNNNKRIYKKDILEREISKLQEKVADKTLYGELDHPEAAETSLSRSAILITALEFRGDDVWGKAKILETPMGQTAKALLKDGKLGISSRGLGTVSEDGHVNSDFSLLTFDLVASPSNQSSWVDPIYESMKTETSEKRIDKTQFRWHGGQMSAPLESGEISENQKAEWLNLLRRSSRKSRINESEQDRTPISSQIPTEKDKLWAIFENPDGDEMFSQWQGEYAPTIYCVFDDENYDITKEFKTKEEFTKFIEAEKYEFVETVSDDDMGGEE